MDNRITLLAGCEEPENYPIQPFEENTINFLIDLSHRISTSEILKVYQEVRAFGFWCRESNLRKMCHQYHEGDIGIGKVFHIVASNVPCLFAYSLAISMICGNSNIVRLSTRVGKEDEILVNLIKEMIKEDIYEKISNRLSIITYDRSDEISEELLNHCDGYIVWGGDETVKRIRSLVVNPDITELVFPDRYSIAIFDVKEQINKTKEELTHFVHRFYNDTYQVNQNACSSPRFVFWVTKDESEEQRKTVQKRFWDILDEQLKDYVIEEDTAYRKYEALAITSLKNGGIKDIQRKNTKLMIATLEGLNKTMNHYKGNCGVFYQMDIKDVSEIAPYCDNRLQTITYSGLSKEEIRNALISGKAKGGRRIVTVGEALSMFEVWDGRRVYFLLTKSLF